MKPLYLDEELAADDGAGEAVPRHPARLEDLLRLGRRPLRQRLVPRHRHRDGVPRAGAQGPSPRSRRSRRSSPPTRASPCRASTSGPRRRATSARRRASIRDVNFLVYHSGYDIGDTQRAYRGDARARSDTNTVDGLIKSLRENHWDASRFRKKGKRFGNVPNVYAELGLGLAQRDGRPRPGRPPARQADHARRAEADRLGHRQPLVRLARRPRSSPCAASSSPSAARSSTACPTGSRATSRTRPARRRAPSARSATASSAATPPAPTASTPTPAAARSPATTSRSCASDGYLRGEPGSERESAPLASHVAPGAAHPPRGHERRCAESQWSP